MGHCVCTPLYTCPWCRAAIERAEGEREHRDLLPFEDFDVDAEAADMIARGAA